VPQFRNSDKSMVIIEGGGGGGAGKANFNPVDEMDDR